MHTRGDEPRLTATEHPFAATFAQIADNGEIIAPQNRSGRIYPQGTTVRHVPPAD